MRFVVLASGSSGNSCLLQAGGFGLLLDIGLGPRALALRLAQAGSRLADVHAVLLTHTHGDHWNERTLVQVLTRGIRLYCHPTHRRQLAVSSHAFAGLERARLVRTYRPGTAVSLSPGVSCLPFAVRHDSEAYGFRFEGGGDLFDNVWSLGYAADLGAWDDTLLPLLADVEALALEFNHDVPMQLASGRPRKLIERVLSDEGHLSNEQAAGLLACAIGRSSPGRLRHVIQLHLSRQCNRPTLAAAAAQAVLAGIENVQLHTAAQDSPVMCIRLGLRIEEAVA